MLNQPDVSYTKITEHVITLQAWHSASAINIAARNRAESTEMLVFGDGKSESA